MQCLKILSSIDFIFKGINKKRERNESQKVKDWYRGKRRSKITSDLQRQIIKKEKKKMKFTEDNIFEQTEKMKTSKREFVCELKMSTYRVCVWKAVT